MFAHPALLIRYLATIAMCVVSLGWSGVGAQTQPALADASALYDNAQRWLDQALADSAGKLPLRMEVTVGELDHRLKLAPCLQVDPYIPSGTQLWGKTRLGLRCTQGASRWNVFLPITVKAFGPAWVIKGQVPQGRALTAADAMPMEVDWAEFSSSIVANEADWIGQTATRMLTTGQTLRQGMVRPAQVFQAGASVRVVAQGPGFQVSSDAQALSAGVVGQMARVRMENGRVSSGVVLDMRTVKIDL